MYIIFNKKNIKCLIRNIFRGLRFLIFRLRLIFFVSIRSWGFFRWRLCFVFFCVSYLFGISFLRCFDRLLSFEVLVWGFFIKVNVFIVLFLEVYRFFSFGFGLEFSCFWFRYAGDFLFVRYLIFRIWIRFC